MSSHDDPERQPDGPLAPRADPAQAANHAVDHAEGLNRRVFLGMSLTVLPVVGFATASLRAAGLSPPAAGIVREVSASPPLAAHTMPIMLRVNNREHRLDLDPRTSLLDALREELALGGSKKGCDHGQCGACTVLVDGRRVLSCLTLAATASGRQVTTIEGLAQGDRLHPVQEAFLAHDAFQCGYCTPGQIVSAVGLLAEGCPAEPAQIRECMSGNLCRCGAYPNIVAAIEDVRAGRPA